MERAVLNGSSANPLDSCWAYFVGDCVDVIWSCCSFGNMDPGTSKWFCR